MAPTQPPHSLHLLDLYLTQTSKQTNTPPPYTLHLSENERSIPHKITPKLYLETLDSLLFTVKGDVKLADTIYALIDVKVDDTGTGTDTDTDTGMEDPSIARYISPTHRIAYTVRSSTAAKKGQDPQQQHYLVLPGYCNCPAFSNCRKDSNEGGGGGGMVYKGGQQWCKHTLAVEIAGVTEKVLFGDCEGGGAGRIVQDKWVTEDAFGIILRGGV